jgi:hypothetical protein
VAHGQAAVGGQPVPHQGRLLPAEKGPQLAEGADEGVGVVGAVLMVEGDRGTAAT